MRPAHAPGSHAEAREHPDLWSAGRPPQLRARGPRRAGEIELDGAFYRLEMPQLSVAGLSEFWLLKEIGRVHWHWLFARLGIRPVDYLGCDGGRIYPTFARIRFQASQPLARFGEGDVLVLERIGFERYGGHSLSRFRFRSASAWITVQALSIDARRTGRGNQLARVHSEPLPAALGADPFVRGFEDGRRTARQALAPPEPQAGGAPEAADYVHRINPFAEVNGVNLLYFAAQPIIANLAERETAGRRAPGAGDVAFTHSTDCCDVSFFRNCDVADRVWCRIQSITLDSASWRKDHPLASAVALRRMSDGKLMSVVHTHKAPLTAVPLDGPCSPPATMLPASASNES